MRQHDLVTALAATVAFSGIPATALSDEVIPDCTSGAASDQAQSEKCREVIVVDSGSAAVALTAEQRLAFFRAYNQRRLQDQTPEDAERADRACEEVVNVGPLPQNDYWLIKCSDERAYAVQITPDSIMGPLDCFFLENYFGQSCDAVAWTLTSQPPETGNAVPE